MKISVKVGRRSGSCNVYLRHPDGRVFRYIGRQATSREEAVALSRLLRTKVKAAGKISGKYWRRVT